MLKIRTLPELISMMNRYKNNPMILSYYSGNDWHCYKSYDYYNTKEIKLSKNLYLVNCVSFQKHNIKTNDIIKVLDGSIIIDSSKRIDQDDLPYIYDNYNKNYKFNKYSFNDLYTGSDGKIDIYMKDILNKDENIYTICEGKSLYNTFLHYKSL